MDTNVTYNQLLQNIAQADISVKIPVQTVNFQTTGLYSGKYAIVVIEPLDPFYSRVYAIDGANIVKSYSVSTSTNNDRPFYATPTGDFKIGRKSPSATSTIWNMVMPWWQQFYSGFGFHGRMDEAFSELDSAVSGGCVVFNDNINAENFYNWTSVGMPVTVIKAITPSCEAKQMHNYNLSGGGMIDDATAAKLYKGACVEN